MVEWLERMSEAVAYMEANLTHEVDMAEVATRAYSSSFHFQRMFHMLPESVARAVRKVHGLSPSEARNFGVELKAFLRISFHLSLKGDKDMDYKIGHTKSVPSQ